MALFWRLWAAVVLVNFAVLVVFIGLATLQFGEVDERLLGERLIVLAKRTAAPLEAAATLGLPLSSVRTAPAVLERTRQADEAITAIHIFDSTGRIVHSTTTDPPLVLPRNAIAARAAAAGKPWYLRTSDSIFGSIDIAGRDDATAGGVLIVYPDRAGITRTRAMAAELTLAAISVLAVSAALGAALLRLGLASQLRLFETIDNAVDQSERDSWRRVAGGPPVPVSSDAHAGLLALLNQAEARYRAVGRTIAESDQVGRQ